MVVADEREEDNDSLGKVKMGESKYVYIILQNQVKSHDLVSYPLI